MRFVSPNGVLIIGTLAKVPARVNALEYDADGIPQWDGGTELFWDEMDTVERKGSLVYIDEEGGEWAFDQLSPKLEDIEETDEIEETEASD